MSKQKQQADVAPPQEQQAEVQPPADEKKAGQQKGGKKGGQKQAEAPRALEVRGPVRGRWRAGRRFGPDPVVIPLAELADEERAAIEADPVLSVREVEIEA